MKIFYQILILLFLIFHLQTYSQTNDFEARNLPKNEIYFSFYLNESKITKSLSQNISIEKIIGNKVYAYSNRNNFIKLKENFQDLEIIETEFANKNIPMAKSLKEVLNWNYYPTYSQYEQLITDFANNYPEICKKENIGKSINGRNLWLLKISDNVHSKEAEPEFLNTATIHGNEPLGYVLSLRLINYLLVNYGTNQEITELVNNHEIWINPLANPDGTYAGGDNTLSGATRFNANGVDLNRNFPDPENGLHPDGNVWQLENVAMMNFINDHNFVMSANLHTGSEVVNYPWDTWSKLHTDDAWFQKISHQYADTAQFYSSNGYLTDYNDGITNGFQWYEINGGAQDYMTYFQNCRSIILELCSSHLPDTSLLSNYWEYNYRSLINLIKNCNLGINGIVTDSLTGLPLKAEISFVAHDFDNSFVVSDSINGDFYRPTISGNCTILVSALNYYSYQIDNISIEENESKYLEIKLVPIQKADSCNGSFYAYIRPNLIIDKAKIKIVSSNSDNLYIKIINTDGKELFYNKFSSKCNSEIEINFNSFKNGIYYVILIQDDKQLIYRVLNL